MDSLTPGQPGPGQPAPVFSLPDLDGKVHSLDEARGRIAVINFWSAECPQSARADGELLTSLGLWGERVRLLTIAANANETPDMLRRVAGERGLPLLLHDPDQQVVDLYGAQTTPHLFVVDPEGILRYQGALDDVTFRRRVPTQQYLLQAVEALLAGRLPEVEGMPAYGCMIVRYPPD
jgi:peroxiredoxin